ncbi:hypothetical protein DENSPDRAFT_128728 [Dentipellis sp. KUC8613]|nr:hypothetical protein DENSPDRAFT_128728 [Dentipellis sp. KUC8613]
MPSFMPLRPSSVCTVSCPCAPVPPATPSRARRASRVIPASRLAAPPSLACTNVPCRACAYRVTLTRTVSCHLLPLWPIHPRYPRFVLCLSPPSPLRLHFPPSPPHFVLSRALRAVSSRCFALMGGCRAGRWVQRRRRQARTQARTRKQHRLLFCQPQSDPSHHCISRQTKMAVWGSEKCNWMKSRTDCRSVACAKKAPSRRRLVPYTLFAHRRPTNAISRFYPPVPFPQRRCTPQCHHRGAASHLSLPHLAPLCPHDAVLCPQK